MPYKTGTIRIPKRFYDDHVERDLPAPIVIKSTTKHYWIDSVGKAVVELLDDAEFYADADGPDVDTGLRSSARATARAIRAAQ